MAHPKMKAIFMPFKELKLDEEGNPVLDKKTGLPTYKTVYRKVRHNASYFPHVRCFRAEKPTC